jgi:tetraacyldisaccharide 4'-kinase
MRDPSFWWQPAGAISAVLAPLAAIYDTIATRRMQQPGVKAGVPVVCIGDPTLGGAGKTPTAIAVAGLLKAAGVKPVFLTRGYGGSLSGPVMVSSSHRAREVGDEPLLLARTATTIVSRDRIAGAKAAIAQGAEVIILDDGFQNPALVKDLALLVIDGHRGVGNTRVFPAGPLRAALKGQVDRARAVVLIGDPTPAAEPVVAAARARGLPAWTARLEPDPTALAALAGRPVLAFAGIGHPGKFFAMLERVGVTVGDTVGFPDHHPYTPQDAADLGLRAERGSFTLVTTEKDHARLSGEPELAELARRAATIPVNLVFDDVEAVRAAVQGL